MTYYAQARRFLNLRTYLIVAVVLIGALVTTFGDDVSRRLVGQCAELPAFRDDVPDDVRAELATLHSLGLLYCSDAVEGLEGFSDRIYWGSDGVSSVLFFQPSEASDVGVTRYGFGTSTVGDAFVPGAAGAAPPDGFRESIVGRPVLTSQAPEGASYYYRVQGAPIDADSVVSVSVTGVAEATRGFGDRDVFRDLEILWAKLRRQPEQVVSNTTVRTPIPIVPERWEAVRRRWVNPELAPPSEEAAFRTLRDARPSEPTPYEVVSGPLATTVWVAGVLTGTEPAMLIATDDGVVREPVASSLWTSQMTDLVLAHFAFEPLEAGATFEARYWHEADLRSGSEPDYVWPLAAP